MRVGREHAARSPGQPSTATPGTPAGVSSHGADAQPLTEDDAEAQAHGICFKTGPPGRVGVELEWLVCDRRDPGIPVDQQRLAAVLAGVQADGVLPGGGRVTVEPGGQIELSSAPATGLAACVAGIHEDLATLRRVVAEAGLRLAGQGIDPCRPPRRVLDLPRYAAMEEFFDRSGQWGRIMMCSTASVQICLDAGEEGDGPASFGWRWRLLHAVGPVMVAAFANSPVHQGRLTGWKSARQAVWSRLDPSRTRSPSHAEPSAGRRRDVDPRAAWAAYALAANVLCVRRPAPRSWTAPAGLTFRDWLRGAGERPATRADLAYHLSTLFPPVRPRGHLEFRAIDAQPGASWTVPAAVVHALADDPVAAQQAMAAAEPIWDGEGNPWLRAARDGPADPGLAMASRRCFEAAESALVRLGAPAPLRRAVTAFAERYVARDRCPADDMLESVRAARSWRAPPVPDTPLEDWL